MSQKKNKKILLTDLEYCHVINKRTGKIRLVEGPSRLRFILGLFEEVYGKKEKKIILNSNQYAIVLNPYDIEKRSLKYGDREVRVGSCAFSLHPGEELDNSIPVGAVYNSNCIKEIYVLERHKGLVLKALKTFKEGDTERKAGDEWIIKGPIHYIPHKYVKVKKLIQEISLGEHCGIYIKNRKTGETRLEKGVKNLMLEPEEVLFEREYTKSEIMAIRFSENFDRTKAQPLWILENEMLKYMSENKEIIEFGPKVIILEPFQRPFIMTISGGTPKGLKCLKIWKVMLGPRFSTDLLDIRTKDNAVLQIKLRYKWRFNVDPENPNKVFAVSDFIGLATETMAGIIRDEAAKLHFDELHSQATSIIKRAIFKDKHSYIFEENGFEIFDIDIKEIKPKDTEIAKQMNDAIKSNMQIFVNKMEQKARLESERLQLEGKKELEARRKKLLELEHENMKAEERVKTEIKIEKIKKIAEAEAEAIKIKKNVKREAEIAKIKGIIEAIGKDDADKYLKLQQILSLKEIEKMAIIPTDSNMFLPIDIHSLTERSK